jgi:hypothetical protein
MTSRKAPPRTRRRGSFPAERRAQGSALRDAVSREAQGGWKPPKKRRDPIEVLTASNEGRMLELVPIRFGRMLQSPFTFYRGSAAIMAADLASTPNSGLRVQACGDAHLLNFGGFATPERQVVFDVNDLDETLPAPWEWDVKRLTASIVIAAQYLRLHESEAARAATAAARAYRERMADYSSMRALDVWYDTITVDRVLAETPSEEVRKRIVKRLQKARQQSAAEYIFPKLAEHHGALPKIKDNPPLIFHLTEEQAPGQRTQYREVIASYRESLAEHVRVLFDRFASATRRSRSSVSAASAPSAPSPCSWPRTMTRFSCRSRKRGRRCSNRTRARACMPITASESLPGSA